jgi:hypothetical protein
LADAEDAEPADAEPPASGATELLRPRLAAGLQRSSEAWLAGALTRLAEREDDVAARLVVALLPVQGLRVSGDLVYDLTVTGLGIYRVTLHDGTVTVEPREEPGRRREVAFRLEGTAAALAGLAAGGIRRRPRETRLEGRGRKLKRLIKAMSEPIALVDLEHANVVVDPGLLLAALVAGIDLEWTADQDFTVAWVVDGEHGGTWTVRIADGSAEVLDGPPGDGATATVHVPAPLLLPLLAGAGAPAGEQAAVSGDAGSVALLRQWFDRAQGLA